MGERLKTGIKLGAVAAAVALGGFGLGAVGVPWSDTPERVVAAASDVNRVTAVTDDRAASQSDERCQDKDRPDSGRSTFEPSSGGV
jgi:hypothetical protein